MNLVLLGGKNPPLQLLGQLFQIGQAELLIFFGASEGLQPLLGQSYGAKNEKDLKYYFRNGMLVNVIGGTFINILLLFIAKPICALFGTTAETLELTLNAMPQYAWSFVIFSMNVMISFCLYSTKRSTQAIVINFLRSFVANFLLILVLPMLTTSRHLCSR